MTSTVFTDHVRDVSQESRDLYLGYLCWYEVHDTRKDDGGLTVSQQDVVDGLKRVGLDVTPPGVPHPNDLFRRVTTQAKITRQPTGNPGEFRNLKFVDISDKDHEIVRRLVVETIDAKGKRLRYEQLVDVVFNKSTKAITTSQCDDYWSNPDAANDIVAEVKRQFVDEDGMLTAYTIRQFIRMILLGSINATSVRSNGVVYFTTAQHGDQLQKIEDFVNGLPRTFADFHSLPLVDNVKQRTMVREAFENETVNAVDDLTMKIREYRSSGKPIRQSTFDNLNAEVALMFEKTKAYEDMLEDKLSETHSRLTFLQAGILRLSGNLGGGEQR